MLDRIHHIAIEGPIGVGKSRLARARASRLGARLVLEPAKSNPLLEKFYSDMPKYSLAAQLVFLVSRYQQQCELSRGHLLRSTVISDYILAKDKIFAGLTLNEDEFKLYTQVYEVMAARAAKPDILLLLRADVDTLMERVRKRGIHYEAQLTRDYMETVTAQYEQYFRSYQDSPLLVVETGSLDYSKESIDLDELVAEIEQTRSGRRVYAP